MTKEQIKEELQNKVKEYERSVTVRSLEVINWLNDLIKRIDVEAPKKVEVKKEIKVELPEEPVEEEKKPAPKRKIVFNRKK